MSKDMKHKETFFQASDSGVPSHWVVQYYLNGSSFPEAAYFNKEKDAQEFEDELLEDI